MDLGNEYKTYDVTFEMTENTDLNSIFSISMGAVNDIQINNKHSIYIDNVNLVEVPSQDIELVELNTNELSSFIQQAKEIINSDNFSNIIDSDAKKLNDLLAEAEKIYKGAISKNSSITQENIDNIVTKLKDCINNLRNKNDNNNENLNNGNANNSQPNNANTNNSQPNNGNTNNSKPNGGDSNINNATSNNRPNTLVHTGQKTYLFIIGVLLVLGGCMVNLFNIKKKNKKNS